MKIVRLAGCLLASTLLMAAMPATAMDDEPIPGEVAYQKKGHGWLLTTPKGMTLYTLTRDIDPGKSTCNGACAKTWPPLAAPADAKAMGDFSIVERDDKTRQWAYRDKPLYAYSQDLAPGDAYGDEQAQTWYVALKPIATPTGVTVYKTLMKGYGLALDSNKALLYTNDADTADKSACDAACTRTWVPYEAPWMATTNLPDWSVITRADGSKQWAFKGKPLYTYTGDLMPGEGAGDGVGSWRAAVLEPPPPDPSWVTYVRSDGGQILGDPNGRTLYAHDAGRVRRGSGIERPQDWEPLLAKEGEKSVGNWAVVENDDGQKQWAWKGMLIYMNKRDKVSGDLNGVRSTDRVWRPITRTGQPMAGTGV